MTFNFSLYLHAGGSEAQTRTLVIVNEWLNGQLTFTSCHTKLKTSRSAVVKVVNTPMQHNVRWFDSPVVRLKSVSIPI